MFDRLYKLTIHHEALEQGQLVIYGDSSKPSLDISFYGTLVMSAVSNPARINVSGMEKKHIELLTAIPYLDASINASKRNRVILSVASRDNRTGIVSKYTPIINGWIYSARPGPLPERTISIETQTSPFVALNGNAADEPAPDKFSIRLSEFLTEAGNRITDAYSPNGKRQIEFSISITDDPVLQRVKIPDNTAELSAVLRDFNLHYWENWGTKSDDNSDEKYWFRRIVICDEAKLEDERKKIRWNVPLSEETGMIGFPRLTDSGAEVSMVLDRVLPLGYTYSLNSKMFPKLNFDDYSCKIVTYRGSFYGDEWSQTLDLYHQWNSTNNG